MPDYQSMSDELLVEKIRSKDKNLYAFIVERYEKKLMKYASYLINDQHKAADAVQESFIKAYVNLNSFNTKKKFSSWMYRIVHNEAINIIKKYKKEVSLSSNFDLPSKTNIEDEMNKKEIIEKAKNCLSQMPIIYSEPLALYYLEDKSYEEISDILRIPMGTVATRINRSKVIMKNICQKKN